MRAVFLGILLLFESSVYALMETTFKGEIRDFAVGNGTVFVVTDSQLLQLRHDLVEEKHRDISNRTHPIQVNILLPFEANQTLITCGTSDCGYCEVLDINDITRIIHRESIEVGPSVNKSAAAFLVDFKNGGSTESYMLVSREISDDNDGYITFRNTLDSQTGGIFSKIDSESQDGVIKTQRDVEWVDGFQSSSSSHSYLLVNIKSKEDPAVVVLQMNNSRSKADMIRSLKGARLHCCEDKPRPKLLSSSPVLSSDSPLLWAGIFTAGKEHDPEDTALAVFNLSQLQNTVPPEFSCSPLCAAKKENQVLNPLVVLLKHSSMTAVVAETKGSWTVFYIGTANGQLMKMTLDKHFNSGCAKVLYRSDEERRVFARMYIDPVDNGYIYIALRNKMRRVAMTCSVYMNLRDCRASQDPFCGWCVTTKRCSTLTECPNSIWIPVPEDFFQNELITFHVAKDSEEVAVNLKLNAQGTGKPTLKCSLKAGTVALCDNTGSVFPHCSCSFSSQHLSPDGVSLTVTVTVGDQMITEHLKLMSCPDITETSLYAQCVACVSAGCHWSPSDQTCSWTNGSLEVNRRDACGELFSMEYTPEIVSLIPVVVSTQGRNKAIIKGKNLETVMKIGFQWFMECDAKETPVLERSNGSLTFNIPSGHRGKVRVCVVTADGHCHSKAYITYGSMPICTGLQPTNTWARGGRKIRVLGSSLEYVEKIIVNYKEMSVKSNTEGLWFNSPPLSVGEGYGSVTVALRVGNSTLNCVHKLSYFPDPEFISFSIFQKLSISFIFINKKEDRLNISAEDIKVEVLQREKRSECLVTEVYSTAIICSLGTQEAKINVTSLLITIDDFSSVLNSEMSMFCV